jgi:hypothetical protein
LIQVFVQHLLAMSLTAITIVNFIHFEVNYWRCSQVIFRRYYEFILIYLLLILRVYYKVL